MPQVTLEAPDFACDPAVTQSMLDYAAGFVSMEQIEGVMEEEGYPVKK